MKKAVFLFLLVANILSAQASESLNSGPLKTVESVDLNRYVGLWYEIAKYPNWFQRKCGEATADYTLLPNGLIEVHNTCRSFKTGQTKDILGVAKVMNTLTNAQLKVSFLPKWLRWTGIGAGKYWIIDLEPNYEYAVVSEPSRKFLWILSRTPSLKRKTYEAILEKIQAQHLDIQKLQFSRDQAIQD